MRKFGNKEKKEELRDFINKKSEISNLSSLMPKYTSKLLLTGHEIKKYLRLLTKPKIGNLSNAKLLNIKSYLSNKKVRLGLQISYIEQGKEHRKENSIWKFYQSSTY